VVVVLVVAVCVGGGRGGRGTGAARWYRARDFAERGTKSLICQVAESSDRDNFLPAVAPPLARLTSAESAALYRIMSQASRVMPPAGHLACRVPRIQPRAIFPPRGTPPAPNPSLPLSLSSAPARDLSHFPPAVRPAPAATAGFPFFPVSLGCQETRNAF
jgi:hypothetical protein